MPKLPRVREVDKVLTSLGFIQVRQSGSHAICKNDKSRMIIVPVHGGRTISLGVFKAILKDVDMTEKDFWKMK